MMPGIKILRLIFATARKNIFRKVVTQIISLIIIEPPHDDKTNEMWHVRPAMTQISLFAVRLVSS